MPYVPFAGNVGLHTFSPFDDRNRAHILRSKFSSTYSNNYSFGSSDHFNPFGNYHLLSRIFPRQNEFSQDLPLHPGFSIFKVCL
ncbi:hypothetical protein PGB90_003237 [Kerria lacca]